nr:9560_t:CDS:2 [Entrophospora candida]
MLSRLVQVAELQGNILASCSSDKTIRLWALQKQHGEKNNDDDLSHWTCVNVLEGVHNRTIRSVSWSPNGKQLAAASFDSKTTIWEKDEETGEFENVATLEGHENETKSVAWSLTGTLIATCGRDKSVWIWEASDNDFECLSVLQEHTQDVKMVVWHPTQEVLASASYDDTIKIWKEDDDDWCCADTLKGHESTVWGLDFDKSGDFLGKSIKKFKLSDDKTVKFWKTHKKSNESNNNNNNPVINPNSTNDIKWENICTLSGYHQRCIYSVSWSKINDRVATGGGDNKIHINCVQWSPSERFGNLLASAGDDGVIKIWKFIEE